MEKDLKQTNPEEDQGKPQEETVESQNLEKPSAIQQKAILPIIKGLDVIAQAQSGTGKTAAFAIGSLIYHSHTPPALL